MRMQAIEREAGEANHATGPQPHAIVCGARAWGHASASDRGFSGGPQQNN